MLMINVSLKKYSICCICRT